MSEQYNLQIPTEQEPTNDSDTEMDPAVTIKTEDDTGLPREVFFFNNNSEEQRGFVQNNQNYEILGASIPVDNEHMGRVLLMNSEQDTVKMRLPELKGETSDSTHFIKYKPDGNGKNIKVWECGICHKEFGHQYILMRHLPTHTDERKYECKQSFRQMSTLSQHRAIHSKLRPFICEVCQKTFNRVSTLISHRKTHTGLKPHRCHLCNKAFHQKGNLRNHIFTHTNERPYKCDVCNKGFNQMSNLMCHKFKAHQRADKPKYNCPTCGKLFDRRIALRNHKQYEHGDNHSPMTSGEFNVPTDGTAPRDMPAPSVNYTNGVMIPRIKTNAMKLMSGYGQVPFALLKPLEGVPVLVRVLLSGIKSLLVPATADELKKYCKLTPKVEPNSEENKDKDPKGPNTGVVVVKIPVVATVIQRWRNGQVCLDIVEPGPDPESRPCVNGSDYEEEDENEGESSADEKDFANLNEFDDSGLDTDMNMFAAAASLIDLRTRPQAIEVDQASVEMFNHDELDIDITNSVIDLEKDHRACGMITESCFDKDDNEFEVGGLYMFVYWVFMEMFF
ncbi:uncharacterized protein [Atheta coriaria]|uniref:uncharacterized protein isoform X3 n=1 Tax=Dalotia coriaria TaxID=877792 RepID=UPI0031F3C382